MPRKSTSRREKPPEAKSVDEALRTGFDAVERQPTPEHLIALVDKLSGKRKDRRS